MKRQPRILIIDTQPYNKMVQSRALDSYFHQFDFKNLAQIFSDARTPCKGHCHKLFQITDKRLVKARFNKKNKTGKTFYREDLEDSWTTMNNSGYKPRHKGPLYRFLRKKIWDKKYWDSNGLEEFVASFNPDYIFVGFSKDFFIFDIAIHFAEKYDIPLILSIADDYVFFDEYKNKFLNKWYRKKYLKLMDYLMAKDVFCIFESEKIKSKYIGHYKVPGEVIYISSDIEPKLACTHAIEGDWYYFGNLEYGRFDSINQIGHALLDNGVQNKIFVYSKDHDIIATKNLSKNVIVNKAIPYDEMIEKMNQAGALLVVEGFKENDVKMVEYSLSTKVGDSICFGKPIIVYGDIRCGAIDFLIEKKCGFVATTIDELTSLLNDIKNRTEDINVYKNQFDVAKECFSLEKQSKRFLELFMIND